jgi:hypothetical protein
MATQGEGAKKLADLRVVDLRAELEKRGLDKNGVKAVLTNKNQQVAVYNNVPLFFFKCETRL